MGARGAASVGITTLTIDGVEYSLPPVEAAAPPDEVRVGIDRLYRAWTGDAVEELWVVPLGLPFAVRWSRRAGEVTAELWSVANDGESTMNRHRRMARTWATLNRSWGRELAETALLTGAGGDDFAWARARVLAAVRTGPDRKGVYLGPAEPTSIEVTWVGLALCSMGRADRVEDLLRRVGDMRLRRHLDQWVHRWNGSDGPQPPEGSSALPDWLEAAGPADAAADVSARLDDPVVAAALCCRSIDRGLGLRPDPRFGRVRFAPNEQQLGPTPNRPLVWSGIGIGKSSRATRLRFEWSVAEARSRHTSPYARLHTWQIEPEAGSVPLFGVFEPLVRANEVHGVTLDGSDIEVDAEAEEPGWLRVRFQCPLDGPRAIGVSVS